ncbi:MAG: hypothetical protein EBQ80_01075 [Proteobacteria bacterium]|nr:hypothetical protein [Pseudomonadota bacterium]
MLGGIGSLPSPFTNFSAFATAIGKFNQLKSPDLLLAGLAATLIGIGILVKKVIELPHRLMSFIASVLLLAVAALAWFSIATNLPGTLPLNELFSHAVANGLFTAAGIALITTPLGIISLLVALDVDLSDIDLTTSLSLMFGGILLCIGAYQPLSIGLQLVGITSALFGLWATASFFVWNISKLVAVGGLFASGLSAWFGYQVLNTPEVKLNLTIPVEAMWGAAGLLFVVAALVFYPSAKELSRNLNN